MSMRAFIGRAPGSAPELVQQSKPQLSAPTDILVAVHAVATNPVDIKSIGMKGHTNEQSIGFDCSGVVVEVGAEVKNVAVGEEVFYSGNVVRPGCFAEFHVVDSRIVARKPKSLSHLESAAFPLVSLTAYEALYENMRIRAEEHKGKSIFILPGSGGVGSIAIQLAKLAGLKVIASASRPETREFVQKMGADIVVDHTKDLAEEFKANNLQPVEFIFNTYSEKVLDRLVPIIAPRGHIVGINGDADIPQKVLFDLFFKRVHLSMELMFSRPVLGYEQEEQGKILAEIAQLIDDGKLKRIDHTQLKGFESLAEAEKIQTSGKAIGKTVIQLA